MLGLVTHTSAARCEAPDCQHKPPAICAVRSHFCV